MKLNISRYRQLMENEKMTVEDVAYKTGMPETCINWILESGFLSLEALERMAAAAGVSADEIASPDITGNVENVIEFVKDAKTATVTFSQGRYISRVEKFAEKYPDECRVVVRNKDGSILARIPLSYVRLIRPRELTEAQRAEMADRARRNLLNID